MIFLKITNNYNNRIEIAKKEFEGIVKKYMLPLFDVAGEVKTNIGLFKSKELIEIEKNENNEKSTITFYPYVSKTKCTIPFSCSIESYSSVALKKRATTILNELLLVTEYNYKDFSIRRYYGRQKPKSISYKNVALNLAFELGICKWLTENNEENAAILHEVICKMIDWSSRTYEGKNVPFGIAIDFSQESTEESANYLHFLENDSSAVFTDGIFSGILLDKKARVLSFLTRNSKCESTDREIFVPLQFTDIAKHCCKKTIGVIVQTNGEIIIVKDQKICFAKRGGKWIVFDWERVYWNLRPYFEYGEKDRDSDKTITKIKKLYCTLLDVSFAHTGGCISIVIPQREAFIDSVISERIDLFSKGELKTDISIESKEKIEILTYLLNYSEEKAKFLLSSFFDIEKILCKEIISLDGATVISVNGNFYCAGSIISVDAGSSGGGRTAASKRLAQLGVGIKISEDGYIEAYGIDLNNEEEISEKSKIKTKQLFRFK